MSTCSSFDNLDIASVDQVASVTTALPLVSSLTKIVFHYTKSNKNWAPRFNPYRSRSIRRSTWRNVKWMERIRMRSSKTTMLTLRLTIDPRNRSYEKIKKNSLKNSVDVVQFSSHWCFLSLFRYRSQCIRQHLNNTNHNNSSSNSKQTKRSSSLFIRLLFPCFFVVSYFMFFSLSRLSRLIFGHFA